MNATGLSEALFNALSFSSILILTALGLAITFGVMRVINMAHGEMLMLGAYTAFAVEDPQALPILVHNLGRVLGDVFLSLHLIHKEQLDAFDWHRSFGLNLSLFWAIPISFVVVAAVGWLLEVTLI